MCKNISQNKNRLLEILSDLKENHGAIGLKAEFETEGAQLEEILLLKKIACEIDLNLTVKIGGCGALKDLYEIKEIGVNSIVAPMIESPYALKKFIETANLAFTKIEMEQIKFFINIETITGFDNVDKIFNTQEMDNISGIVFGRADMTQSMNMQKREVDSAKIFEIACELSALAKLHGKDLIIGGGLSPKSIPFITKLPLNKTDKIETRKIIFDVNKLISNPNPEKGIEQAIEFEILWIKNKRENLNLNYSADIDRINALKSLLQKTFNLV